MEYNHIITIPPPLPPRLLLPPLSPPNPTPPLLRALLLLLRLTHSRACRSTHNDQPINNQSSVIAYLRQRGHLTDQLLSRTGCWIIVGRCEGICCITTKNEWKRRYKQKQQQTTTTTTKIQSLIQNHMRHERSESAREQRTALYKSDQ